MRQRTVFARDTGLSGTAGIFRPAMHRALLLALETRLMLTAFANHELRVSVSTRVVDLRLAEQFTTRLLRTPSRVADAVFGVLLRVAEGHSVVEVIVDIVEVDRVRTAHGRPRAAVGQAGAEASVEALSAEDVAAG